MEIYVVRPGDSLFNIAAKYALSIAELAALNQLSDPARLVPGMALFIPGYDDVRRGAIEVNAYAYPNISAPALNAALPDTAVEKALAQLPDYSGRLVLVAAG